MLRITVHDHPEALTFQLEGSLAGPWVRVLEECWQTTVTGRRVRSLLLDLTGVTFIDAAGRACLAAMHRQGAEFIAADCLTKAAVAEITRTTGARPRDSEVTGSSRHRPTEREKINMSTMIHENSGPALEARPTPAGAATAETRDGPPPPSAGGAAHPDHEATDPATDPSPVTPSPAAGAPSHPWRKWLLRAGAVAGLAVGGYLLAPAVETALNTVSTDDAYVNGHVTFVAPRVPGQVARVLVDDNNRVKKGDLLVQLDREPYQVQVDIKKAAVVGAEADLKAAEAQVRAILGQARSLQVEAPDGDGGGRRPGRPPGGTRGGPEEQGGDPRSCAGRLRRGPRRSSPATRSPGRNSISAARPSGRPRPRPSRPSRRSTRRGSPSACRRAPRRES